MAKSTEYYLRTHEGRSGGSSVLRLSERVFTENPILYLRERYRGWDMVATEDGAIAFEQKDASSDYVELVAVDPDTPEATIGFTPGPWTVDFSSETIRADGATILRSGMAPAGAVENEANLVAVGAVPELVAACEACVAALTAYRHKTDLDMPCYEAMWQALAAIAKARGTAGSGEAVPDSGPSEPSKCLK